MRIKELDALRGLAALAVVFFHYTTQYDNLFGHTKALNWSMPYGDLGVHLFFMISGFVIFLTLERVNKPMVFVVARFSRLYPAYWFAILLTSLVIWCFSLQGQEHSFWVTLINFSMLQGIIEIPDVDGVYWTLMYELIFYVLMFSLLKLGGIKYICWFITLALLLNILNSMVSWVPWKAQLFLLLQYNQLFAAGIIFYLLKRDGNSLLYFTLLALCLAAQWLQGNFISSTIISGFFFIFLLFIYQKLAFLTIKPLLWLGTISYSFYLLHQNIGYVIIREVESLGSPPSVAIFSALLTTLLLAHIVMKVIEKPGQTWIKQKYQQLNAR